ncbi:dGTPase [Salinibacter ruber]|uniref:anti-phage deoxyguanosine triphosphatase n=1 Tax=Salinibacter ruber TaxID=146919 RepID=UPI00216848AA|nr:anti-phage deoxyguanosine triphosphatase [Salinibacter ruber]MCS3940342.1 dGTPase [Salinibacter ruber]
MKDFDLEEKWTHRRSGGAPDRPEDPRSPYERDRSRLMHTSGFRRLQGKTQVLGVEESDFHRTRLTHSMEVAQIARGLVHILKERYPDNQHIPSYSLIEATALGHDIGHPPHGHSGEIALNYVMRDHGGFEGNAQTLRLLGRQELYSDDYGLDLTRRALLGVLKYPASYSRVRQRKWPDPPSSPSELKRDNWTPPKCYFDEDQEIVDWILDPLPIEDREAFQSLSKTPSADGNGETQHKSLDASIMDVADDVAYGVHDLEDAIKLDLIEEQDLREKIEETLDPDWAKTVGISDPGTLAENLSRTSSRKQAVGKLVHAFLQSTRLDKKDTFDSPLLDLTVHMEEPARDFLNALDDLKVEKVIGRATTQQMEYRGRLLIVRLFEALASDPERLLKSWYREQYGRHEEAGDDRAAQRVICDYIAGMTDEYATEVYERLYTPGSGRVSAAR